MGELAGVERGRLVVAATPTIGTYWLPSVLVRYRREYPGVEMRMEVHPTGTIVRLLKEGAVDVGLVESGVEDEGVEARAFMKDRLVAIAAKGWARGRKRRAVTAAELCREPFVVREVGSGSLSLVERALAGRGLKVEAAMSLGSTEAIKRAVMEGVGVAIVSGLAVESEVAAGKLEEVRVRDLAVGRPLLWCTARGRGNSAAVGAFEELVWEAAHP
jgi:DNA-binding transcriptional LysR family regulator